MGNDRRINRRRLARVETEEEGERADLSRCIVEEKKRFPDRNIFVREKKRVYSSVVDNFRTQWEL